MRRAVIDIGTNTVKLLVADVEDGTVRPVVAKDVTTRLGEGVNKTHRLATDAIARTVAAVAQYADEARALGAANIVAVATSAARTASNAEEFLRACPVPVEIISGEREARLIFRGASSDPRWSRERILVMDVGGGSAEWIFGAGGAPERLISLPVGAVRLLEKFGEHDFAGMAAFLRAEFARQLAPFRGAGAWRMIGTGGTLVTLARIARLPVDGARLSLGAVRELVSRLDAMPLEQRRRVPGLPSERADIIVAGGAVALFAMESLGVEELTVSVRALRFGLLVE
jgi:exopolyphosphatase/guanosine-5'-triphosphate,3'-diphosphate pyrophosphatase